MQIESYADLALASLYLVIAGWVVMRVRRLAGHHMVAPIALGTFFTLRALSRLADPRGVGLWNNHAVEVALDLVSIVALVIVLVTLEPIIRAMAARDNAARFRAEEYERARRHYLQVVRHRMMNPLTAIKGAAQTMQGDHHLDDATQDRLLQTIVDACDELEDVSLAPERRDALERELDAVPRVEDRRQNRYPDRAPGPS